METGLKHLGRNVLGRDVSGAKRPGAIVMDIYVMVYPISAIQHTCQVSPF